MASSRRRVAHQRRPCFQVSISVNITMPMTSGNQPPVEHLQHVGGEEQQVDDEEEAGGQHAQPASGSFQP
jgi:hypothetical protein